MTKEQLEKIESRINIGWRLKDDMDALIQEIRELHQWEKKDKPITLKVVDNGKKNI